MVQASPPPPHACHRRRHKQAAKRHCRPRRGPDRLDHRLLHRAFQPGCQRHHLRGRAQAGWLDRHGARSGQDPGRQGCHHHLRARCAHRRSADCSAALGGLCPVRHGMVPCPTRVGKSPSIVDTAPCRSVTSAFSTSPTPPLMPYPNSFPLFRSATCTIQTTWSRCPQGSRQTLRGRPVWPIFFESPIPC